jgi:hypothetical protein
MKNFYRLLLTAVCISGLTIAVNAQCGGTYPTQATINWDNLDYYFNSGSNVAPYGHSSGTYISDTREQSQNFAIGRTIVNFATSSNALVNPGAGNSVENLTHTGDITGYTGADVQYNPTVAGQTITLTFTTPVLNVNFALYDIDRSAVITVSAADPASGALTVTATPQGSTILTVTGITSKIISDLTGTTLGNADNRGTATIGVAGSVSNPVKTIVITITSLGSDAQFWFSDMTACVNSTFTTNYHQLANNRPFWGPTQTMPDYFLVTPDNDSIYMIDPATATARYFFHDNAKTYTNSLGYDPYNHFLYYISENVSVDANNKTIKRYNYNTETSSTIIADLSAAPLNIPTFNFGNESAGCAFYDGALYFGIEGGTHSSGGTTTTRETIIWRIDFDGSNNPLSASQVYATNYATSGSSSSSLHDWGDFIIKNGVIYNSNTARNGGNYSQSKFHHFNMMTGAETVFNNPGTTIWSGQIAMTWAQGLYYFRPGSGTNSVIGTYDELGNIGGSTTITRVGPHAGNWPGGSGDASDPIRPKCDFGDAPASYDPYVTPATQSPAVHERSDSIRLGATWDGEFDKRGVLGTNDVDDGAPYVNFLPQGGGSFLAFAYVTNTSTTAARVIAWLDYNANGTFDASEAVAAQNVPSGTNNGLYWFYWPSYTTPLVNGQATYMRIRVTSAAAGMTTSHATGYFTTGEVEDYRIPVDNFPLSVSTLSFTAAISNNSFAKLNWTVIEQGGAGGYEIQKSTDAVNWEFVALVPGNGTAGEHSYEFTDDKLKYGRTYYRLRMTGAFGNKFSETRSVVRLNPDDRVVIKPNPVKSTAIISIESNERTLATLTLFTVTGKQVYKNETMLQNGTNTLTIPVKGEWPSGTYILKVFINNESTNKKMIIEK